MANTPTNEVEQLLAAIEEEIDTKEFVVIEQGPLPGRPDTKSIKAAVKDGYSYILVTYPIEALDSVGYSGAVVAGAEVIRLPNNLAEKAFKKVEEQHERTVHP